MKELIVTALLLATIPTALAGGSSRTKPATSGLTTYVCSDGAFIKARYTKDSAIVTYKGQPYELPRLGAGAKIKYGDAEHGWNTMGKTAEFIIGAAGEKKLTCTIR